MLLTVKRNDVIVEGACQYVHDSLMVVTIGHFYCGDRICSGSDILSLYASKKEKLYDYLDGSGIVVIADGILNKLFVFTDFFNSPYFLFYRIRQDAVCFSDSIFNLAEGCALDQANVREFIKEGYVKGEHTTVAGVYKLRPRSYLTVDISNLCLTIHNCRYTRLRKKVDVRSYDKDMADCVRGCYSEGAACALSGGYDSNYILHHMHLQNDDKPIDALCVGGSKGVNEIDEAKLISEEYANVKFHSALVDPETFQHYPEIVYALNGQVYEQGIFLQYTLAKMMSEHGIESCLLGECADQICEYSAYHKISVMNIAVLVLHLFGQKLYWKYPYQFGAYIILKKSGLMMRHFNIDSRYPYIRNPFMDNQFSVVNFFSLKKRIHKEYVSETINPNIAARLRKRGGNTSILAVIQDSMVGGMENIVQNSKWYDSKSVINKKLHLEYLLRVLYVEIFERILHWDIMGGYPTLEDLLPELSK